MTASNEIEESRIRQLSSQSSLGGRYVLYWMQQSQRAESNPALEFAIQRANMLGLPCVVAFGLMDDYPEANARHYLFMLQGLFEVAQALEARGIQFVLRRGAPADVAIELARDAREVVCDFGPLRHQRAWRSSVAQAAGCPVWQVEADTVVPLEVASNKREFAARTIRRKVQQAARDYLFRLRGTPLKRDSLGLRIGAEKFADAESLLRQLKVDRSVAPVEEFIGGTSAARKLLKRFLEHDFADYAETRARVHQPTVSLLSPYLHFGQISPVFIATEIQKVAETAPSSAESYLEELIVRRELAHNFVYYTADYDSYSCLPDWSRATLEAHASDPRRPQYTAAELEQGETEDEVWNAAMGEMRRRGYLHNHLRMYWGKKILEWSSSPQHAHRTALTLNNKYFLDGRDPNSFANVNWVFGLHDRPFQERPIYGVVRCMMQSGLRRKFDVDAYVRQVGAASTRDA